MGRAYSDNDIVRAVEKSNNYSEVLRALGLRPSGGSHKEIKKKIVNLNLNISHFKGVEWNLDKVKKPLEDCLKKDSKVRGTYLKKRLVAEGIWEDRCSICEQLPIWMGKELILELDHIDGDSSNNEISNLRLLCPHCHSQTPTYRKRKNIKEKICKSCGNDISSKSKSRLCKSCFNKNRKYSPKFRKVKNRPDKKLLKKEIKEMGYEAVGRKYGVSGNAVRKWI